MTAEYRRRGEKEKKEVQGVSSLVLALSSLLTVGKYLNVFQIVEEKCENKE